MFRAVAGLLRGEGASLGLGQVQQGVHQAGQLHVFRGRGDGDRQDLRGGHPEGRPHGEWRGRRGTGRVRTDRGRDRQSRRAAPGADRPPPDCSAVRIRERALLCGGDQSTEWHRPLVPAPPQGPGRPEAAGGGAGLAGQNPAAAAQEPQDPRLLGSADRAVRGQQRVCGAAAASAIGPHALRAADRHAGRGVPCTDQLPVHDLPGHAARPNHNCGLQQ
mmetsp:Transcript_26441/g.36407  ORF Transcript_26441/g.36407 Transcript_26441/m.36407 type:complete len:218 (+) Transcript_26441:552-1205(+)